MYYKKLNVPCLPDDLKQDLLKEALSVIAEKENPILNHRRIESEDRTYLNYIGIEDMEFYKNSGGVSTYSISPHLHARVYNFYQNANHPISNLFAGYVFLFVEGGSYCAPHIDDVIRRRNGLQLLLQAGGKNVTTAWWEPKEEFKDLPVIDYCGIPYSKLDKATETCLEENVWHWMKFDSIHSVENLESIRVFIVTKEKKDMSKILENLIKN